MYSTIISETVPGYIKKPVGLHSLSSKTSMTYLCYLYIHYFTTRAKRSWEWESDEPLTVHLHIIREVILNL